MAELSRREELERRLEANPSSIAFAALAEEYRRAGQYEEAIRRCRIGLARHPAYLSAHVTLGRALIEVDQLDEAQRELEGVVAAAPENLAAIRGLAEIHQRRGDLQSALTHYRHALDLAQQDAALKHTVEEIERELEAEQQGAAAEAAAAPAPVDFDSLLASLGQPGASPPPFVEKLLSGGMATLPPVVHAAPMSDADPFAEIERTLRAYETPRLDPSELQVLGELEGWLREIMVARQRRWSSPAS